MHFRNILFITLMVLSTASFSQLKYIETGFFSKFVKITNQDTIFCGNYRSFDDGHSWVNIFDGNGNLDNYFNTQLGLVERNDTLFETIDAGGTWTQKAIVTDILDISYSDNPSVLYGYTLNELTLKGKLKKSMDGGGTWDNFTTLPFEVIGSDSLFCVAMYVASADTAYYVLRTVASEGYLFTTYDGGATWITQNTGLVSLFDSELYFIDENLGFLTRYDQIYRTIDGGSTWNLQTLCSEIKTIDFVSPTVGFLTGTVFCNNRTLTYKTTDAGANWDTLQICTWCGDTAYMGYAFDALNENYAYAPAAICPGIYRHLGVSCLELGVDEFETEEKSILYPNPVSDHLFVTGIGEGETVTVCAMNGEMIFTRAFDPFIGIDVSDLSPGGYILKTSDARVFRFLRE